MKSVRLRLGPKQRLSMLFQAIVAIFTGKILIRIEEVKHEEKQNTHGASFQKRDLTPEEKTQFNQVFSNVDKIFEDVDTTFKEADGLFHRLGSRMKR